MSNFINTYGGELSTGRSGLGAVQRALAAGLSINQIDQIGMQEGISFGSAARDYIQRLLIQQAVAPYETQLGDLQTQTTGLQQQLETQSGEFRESQAQSDAALKKAQRQAAELQARQASPQQSAQLSLGGKALVVRPSARNRFNRQALQIKSMNI